MGSRQPTGERAKSVWPPGCSPKEDRRPDGWLKPTPILLHNVGTDAEAIPAFLSSLRPICDAASSRGRPLLNFCVRRHGSELTVAVARAGLRGRGGSLR